jgi:hypothetical protein
MEKRFSGLPSYVLKGIAATKIDGPEMEAIREACESSKILFESPGVIGETVIHFKFPKYKSALLIKSDSSPSWKIKTSRCENMGWTVTTVPISALRRLSREMIITQFKEYITTLKTKK